MVVSLRHPFHGYMVLGEDYVTFPKEEEEPAEVVG